MRKVALALALMLAGTLALGGYAWAAAASDNVMKAQQALKDKGQDPGPIDGIMGPKTRAAIKAYQGANNMKATGQLDAATAKSLGVESASGSSAASSSGGGSSSSSSKSSKSSSSDTGSSSSKTSKSSSSSTASDTAPSSSFGGDRPSGRNAPSSRDTSK